MKMTVTTEREYAEKRVIYDKKLPDFEILMDMTELIEIPSDNQPLIVNRRGVRISYFTKDDLFKKCDMLVKKEKNSVKNLGRVA